MRIEIVEAVARPMVCLTRESSMAPEEIKSVMGEAFAALGAAIARDGIVPAGPPLALYRDWHDGRMSIDVGMPVDAAGAAKATGELKAGMTPACKAMKVVHRGPYDTLRATYRELEAMREKAGMAMPAFAFEVYLNDPDTTPPEKLETEIYMPVA